MSKKIITPLFLALTLILTTLPTVNAATIHGTIYTFSLEPLKNTIIEINTSPAQRIMSKQGTYSFEAPPGTYTITAKTLENTILTQEQVEIKDEKGTYILDLIVFPNLDEEEGLLADTELDLELPGEEKKETNFYLLTTIIILLAIIFLIIKFKKFPKRKSELPAEKEAEKESEDGTKKVLGIVRREGGRTTQLEIRKQLGLSEAKVSLMVTELEHKGKIQKIKKGRGNVIILKK